MQHCQNVFPPRELEGVIEYVKGLHPDATGGLPEDTRSVISREMSEGYEMVWTARVSRPGVAPRDAVVYNDHEKASLGALLRRVALFLPEYKRRHRDLRKSRP